MFRYDLLMLLCYFIYLYFFIRFILVRYFVILRVSLIIIGRIIGFSCFLLLLLANWRYVGIVMVGRYLLVIMSDRCINSNFIMFLVSNRMW
jgi:hypothetical protein